MLYLQKLWNKGVELSRDAADAKPRTAFRLLLKYLRFFLTIFLRAPISTYVMAKEAKKQKQKKCAARDCDVMFVPRVKGQKFHSRKCNDREWQRLYRERHQEAAVTS